MTLGVNFREFQQYFNPTLRFSSIMERCMIRLTFIKTNNRTIESGISQQKMIKQINSPVKLIPPHFRDFLKSILELT